MTDEQRRIDRILDPGFLEGISSQDAAQLRTMREEAREVETEYSYLRRLAQARIEILDAERDRRRRGAPLSELIEALPRILADERHVRAAPARTRFPLLLAPAKLDGYQRGLERLVEDDTLANLPTLDDDELTESLDQLRVLESELSAIRRRLFDVIDKLGEELAARSAAGA